VLHWRMVHNPKRLMVVAKADELVVSVHAFAMTHAKQMSALSPGLRNQLLRASVSISLNLAEACGYHSTAKAVALLEVAIGSCNEAERVLALCQRLGIGSAHTVTDLQNQIASVRALTYGFRRRLNSQPQAPR